MKTKHPSAFLPLNPVAVTPTFQSARFAGRKTGATGPHLLMAPMRVHCARLFIVLALAVTVECARAQGNAFTYQGELTYSGALANGVFDLQFTIYTAGSGGSVLAGPVTRNAVGISNGVFTVLLDFGAGVFTGADRWVEIGARTNGGTFSALAPRQPLTPAPYAITAANVASGGIPTGTYASAVTFNNINNSFSGSFTGNGAGLTGLNGSALTNVNASTLGGLNPSNFWQVGGNTFAVFATNALGTLDGGPLELLASGARALRLEGGLRPNIIGAPTANNHADSSEAAVIGGGERNAIQASSDRSTISGGFNNRITNGTYSFIGGGRDHFIISQLHGTIGGGGGNQIGASNIFSNLGLIPNAGNAIVGGGGNFICQNSHGCAIGGGEGNMITNTAASPHAATIPGGFHNTASADYSFAAGRRANAAHDGTFVWADSTAAGFSSTSSNQFLIRASGGVGIGTNEPASALHVNGTVTISSGDLSVATGGQILAGLGSNDAPGFSFTGDSNTGMRHPFPNTIAFVTGGNERLRIESLGNVGIGTNNPSEKLHVVGNILASGTVNGGSDRNAKENFAPVDGRTVLDQVVALPISRWNYKTEADVTHLGPMAQDFHSAFAVGLDDKHISMVDADGVALAAIQGLNQKLHEELKRRDAENAELKKSVEELKTMVRNLAPTQGEPR